MYLHVFIYGLQCLPQLLFAFCLLRQGLKLAFNSSTLQPKMTLQF